MRDTFEADVGFPTATVTDAVVCPAPTIRLAGSGTMLALLVARETTAPPAGAGLLRDTDIVAELPFVTTAGAFNALSAGTVWIVTQQDPEAFRPALSSTVTVSEALACNWKDKL